jgi:hypothetical protein
MSESKRILQKWFKSDTLIGRVNQLDGEDHFGLITAYRTDGRKWCYPDGKLVNDILFENRQGLSKHDWVLIRKIVVPDSNLSFEGHSCRVKAIVVESLQEVDTFENLVSDKLPTPLRRQFTGGISSMYMIGERILLLRGFLEKEKERIQSSLSTEQQRLEKKQRELN